MPISTVYTTSFPGFSPTRPTERERMRDPGKRWSRGSRTKLFLREESFVSHFLSGLFATFFANSGRHVTSVFQGLSRSPSVGRVEENPGNEVIVYILKYVQQCYV